MPPNTPGSPPPAPLPPTWFPGNPAPSQPGLPLQQPQPIAPEPQKSGHKLVAGLFTLIVVAAAAAGGWYATSHHRHSSTVTAKKDIPVLTYGLTGVENPPKYPLATTATSLDLQIDAQLFEGLVQYQNQTKVVPLLATGWSNPDNSTWVFNLRQNVKFHSGRTMTAQDVKYTLDYAVAHQNDNDTSVLGLASTIKQVDVTGTYQVKIVTDGPDPVLLNRLAFLGILDSKAKLGDYDAGTGPYILKPGTTPSNKAFDITAFNGYWGGHVYTREVDISLSSDSDQLAAEANNGTLDLAGDFTASQLGKIKNYRPIEVPDLGISFLGLNTEKTGSPLQAWAARQAVSYALNIPLILKTAGLQGQQASQLVPAAIPGHDASIGNVPYNPTKAKQMLAGAGALAAVPLTLSYPPSDEPQATEITMELNAVGFNVKAVQAPDLNTLVDEAVGGQTDIYLITYTSNTLDGLDILSSLVQGTKGYDNPQIDSLSTQAAGTLDPATRISLLQKIAQVVANDKPVIPLYNINRVYVLTKPYKVTVNLPSTDAGVYFWKVYQE